ncbi:MAG TPA: 2-C-methyl-D-erythritol 4-phosphate cytidylyltransferase [Candidatus Omnitrophica bacterium]|jgi:2-C-methyl-D-erythritol 4-phosphate cytidylyltransferase|nr:2-C-methyl-D-erythritol 4-phosphate cytidylyltransferase [Candidatus Omnitrophota bacterium]
MRYALYDMRVTAIVPAAGKGSRIKSSIEKPYIKIKGRPVLAWTLQALSRNNSIKEIIVAVSRNRMRKARRDVIDKYGIKKVRLVPGGKERKDSVANALKSVSSGTEYVLIHDGSRPFIDNALINNSLAAARKTGAAIVAVPVKPTLKIVGKDKRIKSTPDRKYFWEAQTPQVFEKGLVEKAYAGMAGKSATDDSMLVEAMGIKPVIVMGSYRNIKITTKEDLDIAKMLIKRGAK